MALTAKKNDEGKLAPRSSLLMIITGAVLGWVLAFVIIYGVVRGLGSDATEQGNIIFADDEAIRELSEIQPAAGPDSN
ncbi:MAG: hypothetical protein ACFBZ9_11770 [Sphingomonadales bacterium]